MTSAAVLRTIKRHRRFLVSTHTSPDADALSSALAMAMCLKSLGKSCDVVCADAVPSWLEFLPNSRWIQRLNARHTPRYDAAVIVDCGDLARIGAVERLLAGRTTVINIDHHVTNDRFGKVNLVRPEASSTAEVLFDVFRKAHVSLTRSMAELLYSGIMTDTGSFRYESTTPATHRIVAELMTFGFSVNALYDRLYAGIPVKELKCFTQLVNGAELFCGRRLACVTLTNALLSKFSGAFDLRERLFTFLRSVVGLEIIVILTENGRGSTRVNFRSLKSFDVARLAVQFGGGGHPRASGCTLAASLPATKKQVLKTIARQL